MKTQEKICNCCGKVIGTQQIQNALNGNKTDNSMLYCSLCADKIRVWLHKYELKTIESLMMVNTDLKNFSIKIEHESFSLKDDEIYVTFKIIQFNTNEYVTKIHLNLHPFCEQLNRFIKDKYTILSNTVYFISSSW